MLTSVDDKQLLPGQYLYTYLYTSITYPERVQVVWMRRGGALGAALSSPSFSGPSRSAGPSKSGLIPVARLDSGSQRMRHRIPSQTGQWERLYINPSSRDQSGTGEPVSRATVDGSISMDRANGPRWTPATRDSFTGGFCPPRDSFTGGIASARESFTGGTSQAISNYPMASQPPVRGQPSIISTGDQATRSPRGQNPNGPGLVADGRAHEQPPSSSRNQQHIERGWAGGQKGISPLPSPRQRGQPHRLQTMSTDGGLSILHAQPSAPRWSPTLMYQEEMENSPDGWDEADVAQRSVRNLLVT